MIFLAISLDLTIAFLKLIDGIVTQFTVAG
jgi:hypothetical protein